MKHIIKNVIDNYCLRAKRSHTNKVELYEMLNKSNKTLTPLNHDDKLKTQSIAYDFVFDPNNNPLIVEISYGYAANAYDVCEGYWTRDMQWHEGTHFDFCGWMVENLVNN